MEEKNQGKHLRRKATKGEKIAAIVLSSLAGLLVLVALAGWIFLKYSGELRAGMFQNRDSQELQQLKEQSTASEETEESMPQDLLDADWIDEKGNLYQYRDDILTILLMGIDYYTDPAYWDAGVKSNGGNADVLALVILDTEESKMTILNIPRDTMANVLAVDAEGNYKDTLYTNITTAHSYGDGGALSCELTADAVSNLLYGFPINRYAAVSYHALSPLNQAIGGLEITLEQDYSEINAAFTAGATVRLTDYQLTRMITYRNHSQVDGAYKRGLRDMSVLKALFDQCKKMVKEDPGAVLSLYNKLTGYITTDLTLDEISYLAQQTLKIDFGSDTVITVEGEAVPGEVYVEFYPDEQWLHDFVAERLCRPVEPEA